MRQHSGFDLVEDALREQLRLALVTSQLGVTQSRPNQFAENRDRGSEYRQGENDLEQGEAPPGERDVACHLQSSLHCRSASTEVISPTRVPPVRLRTSTTIARPRSPTRAIRVA